MNIKQNITSVNKSSRGGQPIQYIVVHYTAGNGDTAYNNTQYFKSVDRQASAHYFVDEHEIWQCVPDELKSWHCGTTGKYYHQSCRNYNSIGIEMCSRKDAQGKYYIKQEVVDKTIELTKYLMKKYGIPKDRVIRHYDVTHKICPAPFVYNQDLWNDFLSKLESDYMTSTVKKTYNSVDDLPDYAKEAVTYYIQKDALKGGKSGLELTEEMVRILTIIYRARESD